MDTRPSILFVDDEERVVNQLRIIFRQDYEVHTATSGAAALQIMQSTQIDVVVSDQRMPGMTGIELLRHVRADEKLKHLPVLMVTAEAKREQIIEAAQAGVNGYVVKPFTAIALKDKIEKIFERIG